MKRLPDAEFDIMKVVWANEPPITTSIVMESLGHEKSWKAPTVISLMLRLVERDFLRTEKMGKERLYYPMISKEEYLEYETGNFMRNYHESSFISLVNTLFQSNSLTERDIDEMLAWVKERSEGDA